MKVRIKADKKSGNYIVQTQFFLWIWKKVHVINTLDEVYALKALWERMHGDGTVVLHKSVPARSEIIEIRKRSAPSSSKYVHLSSGVINYEEDQNIRRIT